MLGKRDATSAPTSPEPSRKKQSANLSPSGVPQPQFAKVCNATVLVSNLRAEKEKISTSDYTDRHHQQVGAAWKRVNMIDKQLAMDVESPFIDFQEKKAWEDRSEAICAWILGGTGMIFMMRRGDFGITNYVLKVKNSAGKPRFMFHQAKKFIFDKERWPGSNKFWVYKFKAPYAAVVDKLKNHSELTNWDVKDLGEKPMDFIAPDRQIYDHVQRMAQKGALDIETYPVSHLFSKARGIKSLSCWIAAKKLEYEGGVEEW